MFRCQYLTTKHNTYLYPHSCITDYHNGVPQELTIRETCSDCLITFQQQRLTTTPEAKSKHRS